MNRKIVSSILFLVGIGLFIFVIWKLNIRELPSVKNWSYILLSFIVTLCLPLIPSVRMHYFLKSLGNNLSFKHLIEIEYMNKFLYYIAPAKLNLPAKVLLYNKKCGVKGSDASGSVSIEYGIDVTIQIIIALLGVSLILASVFETIASYKFILMASLVYGLILFFFFVPDGIMLKISNLKVPLIKKYFTYFINFIIGTRASCKTILKNVKSMTKIILISIALWMIVFVRIDLLFKGMDITVPIMYIAIVSCASLVIGGVSNVPGGLGIREASAIYLYAFLGVQESAAMVVVVMDRLLMLGIVIIGLVLFLREGHTALDKWIK